MGPKLHPRARTVSALSPEVAMGQPNGLHLEMYLNLGAVIMRHCEKKTGSLSIEKLARGGGFPRNVLSGVYTRVKVSSDFGVQSL